MIENSALEVIDVSICSLFDKSSIQLSMII